MKSCSITKNDRGLRPSLDAMRNKDLDAMRNKDNMKQGVEGASDTSLRGYGCGVEF